MAPLPESYNRGVATNEGLYGKTERAYAAPHRGARQRSEKDEGRQSRPSHSGRLLLRLPPSLHGELARAAESEAVSLNQFITNTLADAIGWDAEAGAASGRSPREDGSQGVDPAPSDTEARWRPKTLLVALGLNLLVVAAAGGIAVALLIAGLTS